MKLIRLILFISVLIFFQYVDAQTITGYVFDASDGEPIIGASVSGNGKSVVTDYSGKFTIAANNGDKLTVNYIGYSPQKVSAKNNVQIGMGKGPFKQMKVTPSSAVSNSNQTTYSSGSSYTSYSSNATKIKKQDKNTGVKWVEVQDGERHGIEIDNKIIVPCKYKDIWFEHGYFIAKIKEGNKYISACYNQEGKCIISENRGYSVISYYSKDPYIKVIKSGKYGICDKNGNELISPSLGYDYIGFEGKYPNLCKIEKEKCYGVYNIQLKKEIISPNKYDNIWFQQSSGRIYFDVRKNGKRGICVESGKEIISPQYDYISYYSYGTPQFRYQINGDSNFYDTGWDLNGNAVAKRDVPRPKPSSSTYSSSSSSSTSSSSSSTYSSSSPSSSYSSSNSQYGSLLFQGTFTNTGVGRNSSSYSSCGKAGLTNLVVYQNALLSDKESSAIPYVGDVSVYGIVGRRYGSGQAFYHVSGIDQVSLVVIQGADTFVMYFEKGDTRYKHIGKVWSAPINGQNNFGNNGGNYNNNNNNYNNNTNKRQPICKTCYGRRLCRNCNGTKLVANAYTKRNEFCEVCHRTGLCPTCNGTGVSPFRH